MLCSVGMVDGDTLLLLLLYYFIALLEVVGAGLLEVVGTGLIEAAIWGVSAALGANARGSIYYVRTEHPPYSRLERRGLSV